MKITTAEFIISNSEVDKCPKEIIPEYAFIGRSNVGKSSLINMLTNHKNLAKTSGRPGKTQRTKGLFYQCRNRDSRLPSPKQFSRINMHKDLMIPGTLLPTGWLKMSVELGGELNQPSCLTQIEEIWQKLLSEWNLSPAAGTYITQGDHTKPITIVTFFVPKKTPEKNGAT
jgi:GTPase SAR1 family protein